MPTANYGLEAPDTIDANQIGWLIDIRDDLVKLDAAYKADTSLTADPSVVPGAVVGSYTGTLIQLLSRVVNRLETLGGRTWDLQPVWMSGTGNPEGVKTAPAGTYYVRTDAGSSTSDATWYKATGSGNTGWIRAGGEVITPQSIGPASGAPFTSGLFTALQPANNSAWGTSNLARGYPIQIHKTTTLTHFWWENGGTTNGNVDAAIYDSTGAKLGSLTAPVAHAGSVQIIDCPDVVLAPGTYYLALSCSSSTADIRGSAVDTSHLRTAGHFQMASAHPLPSTLTFAAAAATQLYHFGAGFGRLV
jgi:hypothetical protein